MTTKSSNSEYLLIFRHAAEMPDSSPEEMQKQFQKWTHWIDSLVAQGVSKGGQPLADEGRVLRGTRGAKITDGPFVEGKEVVGGYIIISSRDLSAAVEIAEGCPGLNTGHTVEVRLVRSMAS